MDPRRDAMDDEQFLMDMIASGSTAAGHVDNTGDTDIYLNMSRGDKIDQPIADADDQKTNVYILTSIILFICRTYNE